MTVATGLACLIPLMSLTAPPSDQQLEFFEKKVRPALATHCFKCHGPKKQSGGLRLDRRSSVMAGGDSGPAVVPGKPDEGYLVDAVRYGDVYQMPPTGKLPDNIVADLTRWVEMGAPWPQENDASTAVTDEFDVEERKAAHWAWRAPEMTRLPSVEDSTWPTTALDRFILARLEAAGLSPAAPANKRTLIRRAAFDLIGMPPTPSQVLEFVSDDSPGAFARVVDRFLASPRFGEHWGRHWLDLVRYAESKGHEFDYTIPNAHEYRDYVIRAYNGDVPYDQFVTEHIAGDLLAAPRRNVERGFNESVLGTGFWFLGEEVHSPVSTRADETDRLDNQLDVFGKTFLGLTIACARCHDHKFDAISTKDYYCLSGFLLSSNYRQARFETAEHNRNIASQLSDLNRRFRDRIVQAVAKASQPTLERFSDYLLASSGLIRQGVQPEPAEIVFQDFEDGYGDWLAEGEAFGDMPLTSQDLAASQQTLEAAGTFFVNSHNVKSERGVQHSDRFTGTLTSPVFTIERPFIRFLVGGGAHKDRTCVNLVVEGTVVRSVTGKNDNRMTPVHFDVRDFKGNEARLVVVDAHSGGWGNIGIDHITFSRTPEGDLGAVTPSSFSAAAQKRMAEHATANDLKPQLLEAWVAHLYNAAGDVGDPLHLWAKKSMSPSDKGIGKTSETDAGFAGEEEIVLDYSEAASSDWIQDGFAFGKSPRKPGDLRLGADPARPIERVYERGAAAFDPTWQILEVAPGTDAEPGGLGGWVRSGRMLRTPMFTLKHPYLYYLARGSAHVYVSIDSHKLVTGPLNGAAIHQFTGPSGYRWVRHDLSKHVGRPMFVTFAPLRPEELKAGQSADCEIARIVQSSSTTAPAVPTISSDVSSELAGQGGASSIEELAHDHERMIAEAVARWAAGDCNDRRSLQLAEWVATHPELFHTRDGKQRQRLERAGEGYRRERQRLLSQVRTTSRTALALMDGSAVDSPVLIRGNSKTEGPLAPRRFLEALGGKEAEFLGSGRLHLARYVADPGNPLTARVMVNRIWHHLMGKGIVASVDNFGVLGQRPTHPRLLDFLALRFVDRGWSVKRMIREIMLSRTYQMASLPTADETKDPENKLLHRMNVKRLPAESIRDAILAVSGSLDSRMYGRSIPVHLTEFMTGRGRPQNGPLDGDRRRSLYISVRRNFLSPMMLAFDAPIPATTVGRRTVSNVPAQALTLMNDPFVLQQSRNWAGRLLRQGPSDPVRRIEALFEQAFSRPPTGSETQHILAFLQRQTEAHGLSEADLAKHPAPWVDLCHTMINVKEFIFVY